LIHGGHFVLIAGEDGADWVEAALKIAAEHSIPLRATRVGFGDVDHVDVLCGWLKNRGIGSSGAVLVDRIAMVGFRATDAVSDPAAVLAGAIDQILGTGGK